MLLYTSDPGREADALRCNCGRARGDGECCCLPSYRENQQCAGSGPLPTSTSIRFVSWFDTYHSGSLLRASRLCASCAKGLRIVEQTREAIRTKAVQADGGGDDRT